MNQVLPPVELGGKKSKNLVLNNGDSDPAMIYLNGNSLGNSLKEP